MRNDHQRHFSFKAALFGTIKSLVIKAALLTYVVHKLRKEVSKCFNTEDYVDLSYNFHLKLRLLIP